ncbi:hypothetical protein ACFQY4_23175 [Catellatospora bangladeshensis]|uniref:Uncharacterized protein n=1 Tax=Catellatospora bangladeshensis TaxID=310355 RepID=A0A8J3NIF5_9ACTN|nr:hypothetical protein [Catellatospora bangladeshensis]GIF80306.1 hypothetical protein Cba03nite_16550 [Catellatospora bangladeshensis]
MTERSASPSAPRRDYGISTTDLVASTIVGLAVLVGGVGLASLALAVCTTVLAGFGLTMVNVALPGLAFGFALLDAAPHGATRLRQAAALAVATVVGLGALGLSWGVSGVAMRQLAPADYVGLYGQRTEVTVADADCRHGTIWASGPRADFHCYGATWQAGGQLQRGRLTLLYQELEARAQSTTIDAYVLADDGYSVQRVGEVESWAYWAGRPLWLLLAGMPLLAAGVLARRRLVVRWIPAARR